MTLVEERPEKESKNNKSPFARTRLRMDILAIFSLVVAAVITWIPRWRGPIDFRWDAGVYFTLGTALSEGRGYRLLNEPGDILAIQYPPLVPLAIALHQRVLGSTHPFSIGVFLKFTWFFTFLAVITLTYLILRRCFSPLYAFIAGILSIISIPVIFYTGLATADLPFALASSVSLLLYKANGRAARQTTGFLFAVVSYFTRTIGITLLVAWILDALFRRQWVYFAMRLGLSVLSVAAWQTYVQQIELSPVYKKPYYSYQRAPYQFYNVSYGTNMTLKNPFQPELGNTAPFDRALNVGRNLVAIPMSLGEAITSYRNDWTNQVNTVLKLAGAGSIAVSIIKIIPYTLGCSILLGTTLLFSRNHLLYGIYIYGTILAACFTPWPEQFVRYLIPILPLLFLAFFMALEFAREKSVGLGFGLSCYYVIVAIVAIIIAHSGLTYYLTNFRRAGVAMMRDSRGREFHYRELFFDESDSGLEEATDWINERAQADDIVSAVMPHWVYLRTHLKSIMPPLEIEAAHAHQLLDSVPVRYLIYQKTDGPNGFAGRYIRNLVETYPNDWTLAFTSQGNSVNVYERTERPIVTGR